MAGLDVPQPLVKDPGGPITAAQQHEGTLLTQPLLLPQSLSTVCKFYLLLFLRSEKDAQDSTDACQCEMQPCMSLFHEQGCRLCKHYCWGVFLHQIVKSLHLNVSFWGC